MSVPYRSPSRWRVMRWAEERLLGADDSWWSGRRPQAMPVVAEVPRALYVSFLASRDRAAQLAPGVFEPIALRNDPQQTLFTILVFFLQRARPAWAPAAAGAIAPTILHSNWRLYGQLAGRPGVLFVRSVSRSILMAGFGRRLARCFPFHRAARMRLAFEQNPDRVSAEITRGGGSAPEFRFEGTMSAASTSDVAGQLGFREYDAYARWLIDQHLSLAIWPRETIVQDMHLDFARAKITPLRANRCQVSGLDSLDEGLDGLLLDSTQPVDCFAVEGLRVFLDEVAIFRS